MTYETRREPIQVQYYEQEAVTRTVMKPVTRQRCIPYNETIMVPKQVVQRVPLSYYDPFSPAIVNGYSSFSAPSITSTTISSTPIVSSPVYSSSSPVVSQPSDSTGHSVLSPPKSSSDKPSTELKDVEIGPLEKADSEPVPEEPMDPEDANDLPAPELNSPDNEEDGSTSATEAGWQIQWTPQFARRA
jgi:hypothetical protein